MSGREEAAKGEQVVVGVPNCDLCGKVQTELGALLFGPPKQGLVSKLHVCVDCYCGIVDCGPLDGERPHTASPSPSEPS